MSENQPASFEDLIEITEESLRPIVKRLREVVLELDEKAVEVVRLGDKAATYGVGPKKMKDGYAYILPYSKWVNLGFYQGALLRDTSGILEGTGKSLRHIKIRSIDDANKEEVKELLKLALVQRKTS